MDILTTVRVVAVVSAGLVAGIYVGDRAGTCYTRRGLSAAAFVQFQQILHVHFVRFMPPLVLTGLLTAAAWLLMIRSQWTSTEFWLTGAPTLGVALIAVITRVVNVPLNDQLMTWNVAAPPTDLRERCAPWDLLTSDPG